MAEWIPVFKTGIHTDSAGNSKTWTEEDLDRIVAAYDPAHHEAPVVIGHPETNSPAWGWVEGVKRTGNLLYVKERGIIPEFDAIRKRGQFKKRSISLYPDGTLRHIGYLGAVPPAVKGLPDVQFGEGEAMTIEFQEDKNDRGGKGMKFFDWVRQLAVKEGVTLEDLPPLHGDRPQSFSEEDVKRQVEAEVETRLKAEKDKLAAEFSEAQTKRDDELKAREDRLRAQEAKARKDGIAAFCEGLGKEGKLTPAMMKLGMGMNNFLEQIASVETTIEFGEADDRKKQTPLEFMQDFLKGLPVQIEFREIASSDKDIGRAGQAAAKMELKIQEKMKENAALSYNEALTAVQRDNPGLAAEYAEEIGR
jgi:hypothetical protein